MSFALPALHADLEGCSFNALPAQQTLFYDGWVIRLSGGGPKRANWVNIMAQSTIALEEKFAYCKEVFSRHAMPLVFRLTEHQPDKKLDGLLADAGFACTDASILMTCDLARLDEHADRNNYPAYRELGSNDWFAQMMRLDQGTDQRKQKHIALLKLLERTPIYGSIDSDGTCASIGIAVLDGTYAGLFEVVTDPDKRRQGHARLLTLALLSRAREQGAKLAYLQVVANNMAAVMLYQSLGFEPYYRYWYRIEQVI